MRQLTSIALIITACLGSTSHAGGADRPMWDIAANWNCLFVQEHRCSSKNKTCQSGARSYNGDLKLDFRIDAVSYAGGGTNPITGKQHLPEIGKSFFVQGQTEFFFSGGNAVADVHAALRRHSIHPPGLPVFAGMKSR